MRGEITTQRENPCGRLVPLNPHFDSSEASMEFVVPSSSRSERVYRIVLDCRSTAISCPCEDADFRARAARTRLEAGTFLENLVLAKTGYRMEPSVLRPRRALCKHAWRCREYLRRHKDVWQALKAVEKAQVERFEAMERKTP